MTTLANASGDFVFCPIPTGIYDIVIVAASSGGAVYRPSIVTGIANGQTIGDVNLYADAQGTATFTGTVTSQDSSSKGTVADVELIALETYASSGTAFTIPLLPLTQPFSATLRAKTASAQSCPSSRDCTNITMEVPAGGPYIGAYAASGISLTQSAVLASYSIDGLAETCAPTEEKSQVFALSGTGPSTSRYRPRSRLGGARTNRAVKTKLRPDHSDSVP